MQQRVLINRFSVASDEHGRWVYFTRQALLQHPRYDGFAFAVFVEPGSPREALEIVLLPSREDHGKTPAIGAFHFMSSYNPERSSFVDPASRVVPFKGVHIAGAPYTGAACGVVEVDFLRAKKEAEANLVAAAGTFIQRAQARSGTLLESVDVPEDYALLLYYSDAAALDDASRNRTNDGTWKAARDVIKAFQMCEPGEVLPRRFAAFSA